MAVTNRYLGDCRVGLTATVGGVESRLRVVNDHSAMSDRAGFEINAGASLSFFYERIVTLNPPNKISVEVRRDNDNTVVRQYLNGQAESADGTSFTFFATSDGTSGGAARAGVYRLYLRLFKDNSSGGLTDYSLDSDGVFTVGSGFVLPVTTADSGCLRSNALVSLAVSAYPSGSTFAYPDVITLTATHTQKLGAPSGETALLDVINSADVQFIAGTTAIDAGTSHTQTQNVNTLWTAGSNGYGARWLPTGNAAFVPTSGAILWTKAITSGAPTVQDGNNVKRSNFFNVHPGISLFKDSGFTVAGVQTYQNSGRTITQDIFKRTGAINATNAIPYIEAFVKNGRDQAVASSSVIVATLRGFDSVQEATATVTTTAGGAAQTNYTLTAIMAAFNRFVKAAQARQTGSHVATGPDNPLSPPASFSLGNGDGSRTAPFPGYPRTVRVTGNAYASLNPLATVTGVFGVNSEVTPDDVWSGPLTAASLNVNGVPTGGGSREQTLGAGSLKTKWTSLCNEGNVTVIDQTDFCAKDAPGRDFDFAGSENIYLSRALFDDTQDLVVDAGTALAGGLDLQDNATFGYRPGTTSLDTVAGPADGTSYRYYMAGADTTAQRNTFALSLSGTDPVVGFTGDSGNFGFFTQLLDFSAADLTIGLSITPQVVQTDPTLSVRFGAKVFRITPDNLFVAVTPDTAPVFAVWGLSTGGTGSSILATGTALPGDTSSDFYFDVAMPLGYEAINVTAFTKVNGARTPGGGEASVQIGYKFDAVDFAAGVSFK